jgi:hypothetical protein
MGYIPTSDGEITSIPKTPEASQGVSQASWGAGGPEAPAPPAPASAPASVMGTLCDTRDRWGFGDDLKPELWRIKGTI